MNNVIEFKEFLEKLSKETKGLRKATFLYQDEMLDFLNVDLDFFDNLTIIEIRDALIAKRETSK